MVPLLQQVIPFAQGQPAVASLAKEMVLFAARGFKVGRTLEEPLEQAFDAIAKMPPNPKASGQQGGKGDGKSSAGELAMAQAHEKDAQLDAQAEERGDTLDAQVKMAANAVKQRQVDGQLALEHERLDMERGTKAVELAMAREKTHADHALRAQTAAVRGAGNLV